MPQAPLHQQLVNLKMMVVHWMAHQKHLVARPRCQPDVGTPWNPT